MNTRVPSLTAALLVLTVACGRKDDPVPDADAVATASASAEDRAATPPVNSAERGGSVPGVPAAPELPALRGPSGPDAEGNVPSDVEAALLAKGCAIVEARLPDCAATEAFRSSRSNFVKAKAPAHVRTLFNLLGAEQPAVRLLVLDAELVHYAQVYGNEQDPAQYEPLLAAALTEDNPDVRAAFADAVAKIPVYADHRRLIPYLGAVGEIYSADEGGRIIVEALEGLWSGDCQECKDALLGIALRNPDPAVRIAAVQAAARDELPAETLCGLVTRTLEVPDEDLARIAVDLFTRDEPSCAEHYDAWLAEFPKKAKAGTLPSAWLDGAMNIIDGEHGAKHAAVVRKMAKELQAMVGEDHELRGAIDELASPS